VSRYGTINGGTANARTIVVQAADPDSLFAVAAAAVAAMFAAVPPLVDPVATSVTLTGAGDGHMFFLELEFASAANVSGGADIVESAFFLAADAETLQAQISAYQSLNPILDVHIAGAAKGQRVMALVQFGTLRPSGGPPPIPLTRELYVDPNGDNAFGDGSIINPYQTIQFALDQIPAATTAAQSKQVFLVIVSPADYDEDLSIDIAGKRIILTSPGPWGLGTFDAVDWGPSGTLRSITISGAAVSINGIRPGFAIANFINPGERQSTHQSYLTGARISGQILITATSGLEVDLESHPADLPLQRPVPRDLQRWHELKLSARRAVPLRWSDHCRQLLPHGPMQIQRRLHRAHSNARGPSAGRIRQHLLRRRHDLHRPGGELPTRRVHERAF
jgi:hypothetical protein